MRELLESLEEELRDIKDWKPGYIRKEVVRLRIETGKTAAELTKFRDILEKDEKPDKRELSMIAKALKHLEGAEDELDDAYRVIRGL